MREHLYITMFFVIMASLGAGHMVSKAMNIEIERQLNQCGRC